MYTNCFASKALITETPGAPLISSPSHKFNTNFGSHPIICAQKSAQELVGFLAPNKFYYLYLHRNCEDRHDEFIRIVLVDMLDTVSYILINTIYYYVLGRANILCVWLK